MKYKILWIVVAIIAGLFFIGSRASAIPTSSLTPTITPIPTSVITQAPLSLKDKITQVVKNSDIGDSKISDLTIEDAVNTKTGDIIPNQKQVVLDITLSGNYWDTNASKLATYQYTTTMIKAIFPLEKDIYQILFSYEVPVQNTYGNNSTAMLNWVTISRDTYTKINFDNFMAKNIPTIADQYGEHNDIK